MILSSIEDGPISGAEVSLQIQARLREVHSSSTIYQSLKRLREARMIRMAETEISPYHEVSNRHLWVLTKQGRDVLKFYRRVL